MSARGKVAIITGASSGIGRGIAERLSQEGAAVVINYAKSAEKAKAIVASIEAKGGRAFAIQADVSQVTDIQRLFQATLKQFDRIDIVIANAGMFNQKPLMDTTEAEYDAMLALNAKGAFFTLQEAGRHIQDGGRIIFISTGATAMSFAGAAAYKGSKAAGEEADGCKRGARAARGAALRSARHQGARPGSAARGLPVLDHPQPAVARGGGDSPRLREAGPSRPAGQSAAADLPGNAQ